MNIKIINKVVPAVRMLCSKHQTLLVRFDDHDFFTAIQSEEEFRNLPFVADKSAVLVVDETNDAAQILADIEVKLSAWFDDRNHHPDYILILGEGVISIASYAAELNHLMGSDSADYSICSGRHADRIVIVTGGAQGFGEGIARQLFAEGANVVVADLNEDAGNQLVAAMNAKKQSNRALFVRCNVADPVSVEAMITATTAWFGGLDLLISNAGILRAGSLEEMTPETFTRMTEVNYNGFFYCAKYGSAPMKLQNRYKEEHFTDIIQINSKSGLKGSNKNFAYAGAKFGGIGLTQSFALELMPHKIKVNAICPGNFFDGPLWSDPVNGLFVQYLKTGKVPGARSVADVKAFYEAQVPAGRGCRVEDVVKAIHYLVDQHYETGQALPVTGGQNMLN